MKKGKASAFFMVKFWMVKLKYELLVFKTHKRLATFAKDLLAITFEQCQIKKARQSDDLEAPLKPTTKVAKSPRKFSVAKSLFEETPILLKDLHHSASYILVSVKVKVINIDKPVKLSGGLQKKEIVIADALSPARLIYVNTLE